ncbi:CIA30 family protein [Rhodalgimonas zhirmunskyi]|uniref:CIA30 family protein n=1 Tax=Rhodalgimonas zhirmunskyi TaxID=2964767 RepID=A0AAJ1U7B5_9RHOB|nr:CIA30 family protein [Rhodoalgimonas zhirmunskyi]MDQ2094900.1 CIA30 family protein [Rhodoalgimonas zhirmunskyi]
MKRRAVLAGLGALMLPGGARSEGRMIDDFSGDPGARWEFVSDRVMGGVSSGRVAFEPAGEGVALHLTGEVSTKNRGGFLQARRDLPQRLERGAQGLELRVKGNGARYYLHVRTPGAVMPWSFYQAGFEAPERWATVRVPFSAFAAKGGVIGGALKPQSVKSLGVVAYGADYTADLWVARIGVY